MEEFACCEANGSLKPLIRNGRLYTRQELYCPNCAFTYRVSPCPFRPNPGANRAQQRERRSPFTNKGNPWGRNYWNRDNILPLIVELYRNHGPFTREDIQREITKKGGPSPYTVEEYFGGMNGARRAAREALGIEEDRWECEWCGRTFRTPQARGSHWRYCPERPGADF